MNSVTLTLYRLGPYMILSSVKNNTLSVKLTLPILLCRRPREINVIIERDGEQRRGCLQM